jgi:hypothetical protein
VRGSRLRRALRGFLTGGVLLALAGCSAVAGARPPATARPTATPTRLPAEYAGGACQLLTYATVEGILGLHFDVAAADQEGGSYSCVLQGEAATYPDLRLVVTPSSADVATFRAVVRPHGAVSVGGLGKAGYRSGGTGESGGPVVEVGWLSGNARLLMLRVTMPRGSTAAQATAMAARVVTLAKKIDEASV